MIEIETGMLSESRAENIVAELQSIYNNLVTSRYKFIVVKDVNIVFTLLVTG